MANKREEMPPGLLPRLMVSALGSISVIIAALIYLAFYATGFSTFQSIAIVLVVLLGLAAVLALIWVPWGMHLLEEGPGPWARKWEKFGERMEKKYGAMEECHWCGKGFLERGISKVLGTIILCAVIIYLAFYSEGYSLFQNLAIIAVAMLLWGAVEAVLHIKWMASMATSSPKREKPRKRVRKK